MSSYKNEAMPSRSMLINIPNAVSKAVKEISKEVVYVCAERYGFDAAEALRELLIAAPEKKEKKLKEKKDKKGLPEVPLPFSGKIEESWCQGVRQNVGLFTQCTGSRGENGLCRSCSKQAAKNSSGEPDNGLITRRAEAGDEYRDSKGRQAVHYSKIMKKLKLTREEVLNAASKYGVEIDEKHFAAPETKRGRPKKASVSDTESEKTEKKRGRPKKEQKVVEVSATEDLFATLYSQAQAASPRNTKEEEDVSDLSSESGSEVSSAAGGSKKSSEEKAAKAEKKAAKEAEKLAKEAEKAAKAEAKAAKEAEKLAKEQEKIAKEQEKIAKEQEKLVKEQEKLAAKVADKAAKEAAKAAAKEEKKAAAKQAKADKKVEKKVEKVEKVEKKVEVVVADSESDSDSDSDEEPEVSVVVFEHGGKKYLRSSENVLYDEKTQDVVGMWNESTGKIEECELESEDEEEED